MGMEMRGKAWLIGVASGLLLLTGLGIWQPWRPSVAELVRQAEDRLSTHDFATARALLEEAVARAPRHDQARFSLGKACAALDDVDAAITNFEAVSATRWPGAEARFRAADLLLLKKFQLSAAETLLTESLQLDPEKAMARGHLAGIYGLCGCTELAMELRWERVRRRQFAEIDLILLALAETAAENALALNDFVAASPADPLTKLAQAHRHWQQHEFAAALPFVTAAVQARPELRDAQARRGRILSEQAATVDFLAWHAALPVAAEESPEIWAIRGDWSQREQDWEGAARCYWEAARRDPTHRRAHHQLGQVLVRIGRAEIARDFQQRHERLEELLMSAKQHVSEGTPATFLRMLQASQRASHPWEAWAWLQALIQRKMVPDRDVPPPPADTPRVLPEAQPALQHRLANLALPSWMTRPAATLPAPAELVEIESRPLIHFREEAVERGLKFEFAHGDDVPGPGSRMFQFSGGGVGVLDYDLDGWPDVYFTQGGTWPVPEASPPVDCLFRNQRGTAFENVTSQAGLKETDYSQGLAVGDFDNDGFPDIFIANVAGNRLFHNRGDGTFQDVTESAGVVDAAWSTSAAFADLNRDGWPDLYVVNYLAGENLLDRICRNADGSRRACSPHEFAAADDQVLLNNGDGSFRDVTATAGVLHPGGKGLGIVAADFEETGALNVFVGNDTTANFYYQNQSQGSAIELFETAVAAGLAYDQEGRGQACMGIAAGDADGDGRLDLFVTNYYNESNTLYLQQAPGLWVDSTADAGLREPSLKQLGFGTQFLDADADGWLDLAVVNGHVDDERHLGVPLQMPAQFFRNRGQARFEQVPAAELGPWFEGLYLGRGLARIDWNRDGREDLIVGHLDSPAALLTNETESPGRTITLRLIGRNGDRDATGARVRVKRGQDVLVRHLSGGDGYQSSNERQLVVGVGSITSEVELDILWPSGQTQVWAGVKVGMSYIAVEGRLQLIRSPPEDANFLRTF